MNLRQTLVQLAEQSGAKDLAACEQAVTAAATDQRSMVNALLDTGQVDEKVFAQKLGERLGLQVWGEEIPRFPLRFAKNFPRALPCGIGFFR